MCVCVCYDNIVETGVVRAHAQRQEINDELWDRRVQLSGKLGEREFTLVSRIR